jgi:hypothetical protein
MNISSKWFNPDSVSIFTGFSFSLGELLMLKPFTDLFNLNTTWSHFLSRSVNSETSVTDPFFG